MDEMKQAGVYAFLDENQEVVYVGYSSRPIEIRVKEHYDTDLSKIEKRLRDGGIYQRSLDFHKKLKNEKMEVIVLYSAEEGDSVWTLQDYEVRAIDYYMPIYNSAGIICEYFFSEENEPLEWEALEIYGNENCSWETAKKRARKKKDYGF